MLDQTGTRFRIAPDQAVRVIGAAYFSAWDGDRQAKVRILGGAYEHVIECSQPEDLEVIADVMLGLTRTLGEPNYARCDNLHKYVSLRPRAAPRPAQRAKGNKRNPPPPPATNMKAAPLVGAAPPYPRHRCVQAHKWLDQILVICGDAEHYSIALRVMAYS